MNQVSEYLNENSASEPRGSKRLKLIAIFGLLLVVTIPFLFFITCGRSSQTARQDLEQKGISFTEEAFLERVTQGEIDTVKLFLVAGMNPDARGQNGDTALMIAIAANSQPVTEALLKSGASVNARTQNGSTALHLAALRGDPEIARLLIKRKADVDAKTDIGETPLMIAALRGYPDTVKLLLDAGADINAKDNRGETPLMHAVERKHSEVVELLKSAGAKE